MVDTRQEFLRYTWVHSVLSGQQALQKRQYSIVNFDDLRD